MQVKSLGLIIKKMEIPGDQAKKDPRRIKIISAVLLLGTLSLCQLYGWSGSVQNFVCNNDKVLYSSLFMRYHEWVLDHWNFRLVQCLVINLWLSGCLPLCIGIYVLFGPGFECFLAVLTFTYMKGACGFFATTYQDPFGNLQPGSVPIPGFRPYNAPGNDYYFSGHTASATILWLWFYLNNWKWMGY